MRAVKEGETSLSNESAVRVTDIPEENLISDGLEIQKLQGHPKIHPRKPAAKKYSLPTHQKIFERLVHLIKRISTKQLCLVMRWIVNVIGGGVDIQRSQFIIEQF
jgi:hypothetical protein